VEKGGKGEEQGKIKKVERKDRWKR
jgi:hypothetical protein